MAKPIINEAPKPKRAGKESLTAEAPEVADLRGKTGKRIHAVSDKSPEEIQLIEGFKKRYDQMTLTRLPSWEDFMNKLTPRVLAKLSNLDNPLLLDFNRKGEALFCDGGLDVIEETCGMTYNQALRHCDRLGLTMMSQMEFARYKMAAGDISDSQTFTFLDSGENPKVVIIAELDEDNTHGGDFGEFDPAYNSSEIGVRRVFRLDCSDIEYIKNVR